MLTRKLKLAPPQRRVLRKMARSRKMKAGEVRRARVLLRLAKGQSYELIMKSEGCSSSFIAAWRRRFETEGLAGLYARHRGRIVSQEELISLEAKILSATQQTPPDGSTHWSSRKLARHLGVSQSRVARVWQRAGLQPHRLRRYLASPDPELPLSPGRAERHGFEYYRHGTLSLYAALHTGTGEVIGQTAARHTSAEFVAFLEDLLARPPRHQAIHIICDNLSAHKTKAVCAFLDRHPNVRIHYIPTYSSWLNQIEIWFSKIQRDLIARGIFSSVKDLDRKIMRYIRLYNREAKPIKWSYKDASNRIKHTFETIDSPH